MRKALVGVVFLLLIAPSAEGKATKPGLTPLERSSRSVVTVMAGDREGAAFAYGKPGRLVTNAHVVGSSRRVELITVAGRHGGGRGGGAGSPAGPRPLGTNPPPAPV